MTPPLLFIVIFAGLSMLLLPAMDEDRLGSFFGFFHVIRLLRGESHAPLSAFLDAAWSATGHDVTDLNWYGAYHLRFAFGLVYPLYGTLYAAFAEGFRRLLPDTTNYLNIIVRAGSLAQIVHWAAMVLGIAWALYQIRDAALRAKLAVAATVVTIFDYLWQVNYAQLFYGHRVFDVIHYGSLYAMTLTVPRGVVCVLLGMYLAQRALNAPGPRAWLVPLALLFHLPTATALAVVCCIAELFWCLVRRRPTRDLWVLGVSVMVGLLMSQSVAFSGYPTPAVGVLPAGPVLRLAIWQAVTHPMPRTLIVAVIGGLCLFLGLWAARRGTNQGASALLIILALMAGVYLLQLWTGQAIMAGQLTWHDNPSVHSLVHLFRYTSSAVVLGISLWMMVRLGEWVALKLPVRLGSHEAIALVGSLGLTAVFLFGVVTSPNTHCTFTLRPQGRVGEPFRYLRDPIEWYRSVYVPSVRYEPAPPSLHFSDRRLPVGKDWLFTALVYLRALHQQAVFGPLENPEIIPRTLAL